jgi:uncharacterized protein (DUF885 family)
LDTGLHAKHWTRQQGIDYLGKNPVGSAVSELNLGLLNAKLVCIKL